MRLFSRKLSLSDIDISIDTKLDLCSDVKNPSDKDSNSLDYFSHEIRTLTHAINGDIEVLKEASQQLTSIAGSIDCKESEFVNIEKIKPELLATKEKISQVLNSFQEKISKAQLIEKNVSKSNFAFFQHPCFHHPISEFLKKIDLAQNQKKFQEFITEMSLLNKSKFSEKINDISKELNTEIINIQSQFEKIITLVNKGLTSSKQSSIEEKVSTDHINEFEIETPKLTVLIVDDNDVNLKLLSRYVSKRGITYQLAKNGEEAVEQFNKMHFKKMKFDIIFMDIQMPIMDGYEATSKIRQIEEDQFYEPTPIVCVTANDPGQHRERALAVGVDDFITKPFKSDDIYRAIKKHAKKEIPSPTRSESGEDSPSPSSPSLLKKIVETDSEPYRFHLMPNPKTGTTEKGVGTEQSIDVQCVA